MSTPFRSALLVCGLVALVSMAACGARTERTALAAESARWDGAVLVVRTECSEDVASNGAPARADPTLYRLSIFGDPTVGRCRPELRIPVPKGTTRLLDITTSHVVDLPPRPAI